MSGGCGTTAAVGPNNVKRDTRHSHLSLKGAAFGTHLLEQLVVRQSFLGLFWSLLIVVCATSDRRFWDVLALHKMIFEESHRPREQVGALVLDGK